MAKSLADELGTRLSSIEARLNALAGNRLDHASLDGTTLWLKDSDGNLQGRLGRQPDGSNGVHVVRVQPPPQLTAALLTVGEQAGTCLVEWDGRTFDGRRMPLIHGHTEVWAELVGDDWSPTVAPGASAKRVGTIRDRTGGEVVVALPQAGTWAVWLRAMGADRETAGPWSPVATVEITPLVDTEAIEQELDDARQQIEDADQRLTAGQNALTGHLETLNDVRLPALEQDITNAVSEANNNIRDFENRWDTQWDNTIPALSSRQDTLEGDLTTGLTQVHNQAEAMAEAARDEAVSMAAADAQSEYDRLQEIAERALSRAGDNILEDPGFEENHWRDIWNSLGNRLVRNTTSPVRTGNLALVIEDGSPVDFEFHDIDVELDQSYRMTIWYRTWPSNLADLSDGESALVFYDSDTGAELAVSEPLTAGSTYRRAQVLYQVPEGVQSIRPALRASWPTGQMLFDDVSVREVGAAAEALRIAEVARQEAEDAHIAAGNATDAAADAYDAASAKSTVHWSLSAPSGTADNSDDVWWQYELRSGRRVVIGQWFWDDGVWRETEIAEEWLPQVNIGTGTYGDLSGDRLTANTVHANRMLVGPRNIITDLDFSQVDAGSIEDGWGSYTGGWERVAVSWSDQQSHFASVISGHESDTGLKALHYGGSGPVSASLPCEPGERFRVRFQVLRWVGWSNDDDYRAEFRWADSNGNGVGWSTFQFGSGYSNQSWAEFEAVAPEGATRFYFRFSKNGAAAGRRGVGNVSLQKMTGSDLIVDGSVQAEHVDSASLTASDAFLDNAMVNLIQGRMANFDEALIGGTLLKDNSISAGKLTVMPDGADFAPGPGGYEDLWTVGSNNAIVTSSDDPSGAQLRVSPGGGAGNSTRTYGPWLRAQAGDTIYYRMYVGRTDSPDAALRVYFMYDGSVTSWDRVWEENASGWVEGVHTVSDGVESTVTLSFVTSGGTQGNYWIQNMDVRKQVKGVLIEPEGIKSPQVDTEEFFAAQAVIDEVWTNIVRSRLIESQGIITEDMIATGAVTTPKLTVTEEMVAEVVKVMRLEGDEMDFNVIRGMIIEAAQIQGSVFLAQDADGNETVRLDGMDNYLRGSIHAGVGDDAEIRLDYGAKRRNRGLTDEGELANPWWVQTPYMDFHDDRHNYRDDGEPSIFLDDGEDSRSPGQMVINPGYPEGTPAFRGTLNVVGDVASNRSHTRESFSSNGGLYINHSNPNYEGGIFSSGNDVRILGRHHGADHSRGQTSFWRSDQYSLASGGQRRRSFTWGSPPPTGVRSPILSVHLSSAASDRNAYIVANSSSITAAGYNINEHNISSEFATYYVLQLAVWETG